MAGKTENTLRKAFEDDWNSDEPMFLSDSSYIGEYYNASQIYKLIGRKGGNFVKKEDSPNITCIIYGSLFSLAKTAS